MTTDMFHLSSALPDPFLIHYFVTTCRVTRRVSLLEQELFNLPGHMSSPAGLVGFMLLDL
jgi:hypothetical protein